MEKEEKRTVYVLLSGGLDSMACVHFYKSIGCEVICINVDYGQLAKEREIDASTAVAKYFSCPIYYISCNNLPTIYGEIAGRNALLIILALFRIQDSMAHIALAIHAGTTYSDCSRLFVEKMQSVIDLYSDGKIQLATPFIRWSKKDIWNYSVQNNLPINITYSCEKGTLPPCGDCLSCRDLEALIDDFS